MNSLVRLALVVLTLLAQLLGFASTFSVASSVASATLNSPQSASTGGLYTSSLRDSASSWNAEGSSKATPLGAATDPTEYYGGSNPSEPLLGCNCGDKPVEATTGDFWHTFTDITIPGRGVPLYLSRTYNSLASNQLGPLGYGWTFNYNMFAYRGLWLWHISQENGSYTTFGTNGGGRESWVQAGITENAFNALGSLTRFHDQIHYYFAHYDTGGYGLDLLDHIVSRDGYTTTLTYEAVIGQIQPRLHLVTDPENRTITFNYTDTIRPRLITNVADSYGRTMGFDYDANSNLTAVTDVGGQVTHFTYDSNHLMQTWTDPNGGIVSNTYGPGGVLLTQTDPMSRTLQFQYSGGTGNTWTRITDTVGIVSLYNWYYNRPVTKTYNVTAPTSQQAVTTYTYPSGSQMRYEPIAVTDPLSHTWNYTWDNNGNVLSVTDPLTRTTSYAYNSTNDPTIITATSGLTTTFTYGSYGNITSVMRPYTETNSLITSTLTYDPLYAGDVLTMTNPLGKSWGMRYDQYGYLLNSTNPLGETSTFSHDSIGRLSSITNPRVYTATFSYNAYGEPTTITNTRGYTTTYTYDNVGNVKTVTDANQKTITNTYNLDNEVTRVTRPDTTHSDYGYDAGGRVITQTNALTQTTFYSFDDLNRRATVTDPLNRRSEALYDLVGNTSVITDAMTRTTSLTYDNAYQLLNINYSDTATPDVSFLYNSRGMRSSMTDGMGTNLYTYDSLNRVRRVQQGNGKSINYGYDNASRLTSIGYPNQGGTGVVTTTRQYNDANRLTSVSDWLNHTTQFGYDPNGNLTGITYPNTVTATIGYNSGDQLTSITYAKPSTTAFLTLQYSRDPVGLLQSADEGTRGTRGYEYDPLYRLTGDQLSGTSTISSTWGYDAATQILQTTYAPSGNPTTSTTRTYDMANELLTLSETVRGNTTKDLSFTFNRQGDRTQRYDSIANTNINYGYDQASRLTLYNSNWEYGYSGAGLRMSKHYVANDAVENFTWDIGVEAGLPLLLQDQKASYIYGPGGMLIEQVDPANDDNATYYHTDQLGSVRALTKSGGIPVNTYDYDAYGNRTTTTGTAYNPFGYTKLAPILHPPTCTSSPSPCILRITQ